MRFVTTSWLLLLIWVTFNRIYFFIFLQPKTNYHAAHLWLSAISYFTRSGLWRDASTVRFLLFLFHTSQEWKACLSFFFFVKHKSWTVARCIYIIGIHLERHHRVLMGMRVEVDYRDRTAPLREWNAMFMLGFHQKKKKHTHTRVIKHTSIRDHMRLSWVPPVPSRMPGGRLRGWLKGLKREIKVIMYISNPQRFQRAKRPKKKKERKPASQPQIWTRGRGRRWPSRVSGRHGNRLFRIIICHMRLVTIRSWLWAGSRVKRWSEYRGGGLVANITPPPSSCAAY